MRIVCLTYQLIGHSALSYLLEETEDEVVGVFTHEDSPGEEIWWPSVAELAASHGVEVLTPESINEPEWVERLRQMKPDLIVSAWYRNLVKQPILDIPPLGAYNLHGSLLPLYRGRAPVNWVLVNGEQETGMTLHQMTVRADAGDIVGQAVVPVELDDTAATLYERLAATGKEVLRAAWPLLREGKAPRLVQDVSKATYVGRRTPADGEFHWDWPARQIHNLVRAVTHPYPGAFVEGPRGRVFVWQSHPVPGLLFPNPPAPGSVCRWSPAGLEIATSEGNLLVTRLQRQGEEELGAEAYVQRYGVEVGDII